MNPLMNRHTDRFVMPVAGRQESYDKGMAEMFLSRVIALCRRWIGHGLLVLLFSLAGSLALAVPLVDLPPAASSVDLSTSLELYGDVSRQLGVADVLARSADFRVASRNDLMRGFNGGAFWLRTTVRNSGSTRMERWLTVGHPRLQAVSLFRPAGESWQAIPAGTEVPNSDKVLPTVVAAFPLMLEAGETQTILLRVVSDTSIDMAVSIWQPLAYLREQQDRQLLIVMALGGTLITVFMSLSVFAITRESPYLHFALLYLFASAMETARDGLLQQYLWPANQAFPAQVIAVSGACAMFSLIFLLRSFLDLGRRLPGWDRACMALSLLVLLTIPGSLANYGVWIRVLSLTALTLFSLSLVVTIKVWRQGYVPARFMAAGYSVFWVLEGLRQLANQGWLNMPQAMNFSLSWSLLLATPLILLALAERSRSLNAQLEIAKQISLAKSDFLARVSHELRAPLNTIIGYARMLARGSARLSLQEGTADIERNGIRLQVLIDELLDQSRLDAGRLALTPRPVVLATWLDEVERAGRLLAESSGNTFTMRREVAFPTAVFIDDLRLRQVLDNLLTNANRNTVGGAICLSCVAHGLIDTAESAAAQLKLSFSVRDTGRGIPVTEQAHIFEPFFQGKAPPLSQGKERPGVGLGLSITRDLVQLMGGTLTFVSTPGVGSHFMFELTCLVAEMLPAAKEEPGRSLVAQGYRALVAEDDPAAVHVLQEMLMVRGLTVTAVCSGNAAISQLEAMASGQCHWNVVITDQMMADGDGWAVLRFAHAQLPGLPIVLCSSVAPLRPEGLPPELDFDAFIRKPIEEEVLEEMLAPFLSRKGQDLPRSSTRPDIGKREALLVLIDGGRVTDIEEWSQALKEETPEFSAYADDVLLAARRLDFAGLKALAH